MSPTLESKIISVSERGLTSSDWTLYNDGTKRTRYRTVPTSNITAETVMVGGFVLMQKDTASTKKVLMTQEKQAILNVFQNICGKFRLVMSVNSLI